MSVGIVGGIRDEEGVEPRRGRMQEEQGWRGVATTTATMGGGNVVGWGA